MFHRPLRAAGDRGASPSAPSGHDIRGRGCQLGLFHADRCAPGRCDGPRAQRRGRSARRPHVRANVARNGLESVQVHNIAASDGRRLLSRSRSTSPRRATPAISASHNPRASSSDRRNFKVAARALDDVLDEAGVTRVDVMKMDIEGGEARAIAGLRRRLSANLIDCISMEVHPYHLRDLGSSPSEVIAELRRPRLPAVAHRSLARRVSRRGGGGCERVGAVEAARRRWSRSRRLAAPPVDTRTEHMTGSPTAVARTRVVFVNSGILGHRAVAELLKDIAARIGDVTALHLNLGKTSRSAIASCAACSVRAWRQSAGRVANIDLARWRQEMNAGLLAARRIGPRNHCRRLTCCTSPAISRFSPAHPTSSRSIPRRPQPPM